METPESIFYYSAKGDSFYKKKIASLVFETFKKGDHSQNITKTCLFKYTENLPPKNENFQIKKF